MSNIPLAYSKKAQSKKINKNLTSIYEKNFNQLNHPISYKDLNAKDNELIKVHALKLSDGQPFIYGFLNEDKNQIEIYDDSVLILLNWLGNYGNCYFLDNLIGSKSYKFDEKRYYEKKKKEDDLQREQIKRSTTSLKSNFLSNPSNLFELNQDNYRHNLFVDSLTKSFRNYGNLDSKQLIDQLYQNNLNALDKDNKVSQLVKKKMNSFEHTFIELKNSFNQNFIDREEFLLRLDLEEAFFLKQVYGILSVQQLIAKDEENSKNIKLISLWMKCIELNARLGQCFIAKYAVYFYFRSKGFIVKNGIKFGCDFVLYNRNPLFVHSTYSVLLIKQSNDTDVNQLLKFKNVQAFIRMTKCVVKVS